MTHDLQKTQYITLCIFANFRSFKIFIFWIDTSLKIYTIQAYRFFSVFNRVSITPVRTMSLIAADKDICY